MVRMNFFPKDLRNKTAREKLERICKENHVVFLGLFGSFAKGKETKKSDVDLLVKFDAAKNKSLLDLIHTENELKRVFKRKVDLLTENSLSPFLKERILKSLKAIYEG